MKYHLYFNHIIMIITFDIQVDETQMVSIYTFLYCT